MNGKYPPIIPEIRHRDGLFKGCHRNLNDDSMEAILRPYFFSGLERSQLFSDTVIVERFGEKK